MGKYMTVRQIHEKYGIKPTSTYWYIQQKKFRYLKIGKSVFIFEKDFKKFLDNHTVKTLEPEDYEIPTE